MDFTSHNFETIIVNLPHTAACTRLCPIFSCMLIQCPFSQTAPLSVMPIQLMRVLPLQTASRIRRHHEHITCVNPILQRESCHTLEPTKCSTGAQTPHKHTTSSYLHTHAHSHNLIHDAMQFTSKTQPHHNSTEYKQGQQLASSHPFNATHSARAVVQPHAHEGLEPRPHRPRAPPTKPGPHCPFDAAQDRCHQSKTKPTVHGPCESNLEAGINRERETPK